MKTKLLVLLTILSFTAKAQSGFGEAQVIGDDFQTTKVFSADIDGDGDMDVLASGWNANTVAWYENLDGQGNFGEIQYIDQNLNFTQSLSTADIDGDGDMDVLASSAGDDKVVWYKNLDGQGSFSTAIIINNNAPFAREARAADIDGDNDMDVVVALRDVSKVVWYENLNGLGDFSPEKTVTENAQNANSIFIEDIDGDNDLDVLATSSGNFSVLWIENLDGQGTFGTEQVITNDTSGSVGVLAGDIDSDGDNDVFNLEFGGDTIAWFENTDGQGSFGIKKIIANIYRPRDIYTTDIDNDGDIDLLAAYVGDGKVAWFENTDGLGTFGDRKIIEDLASISIVAADIDGDGYKDVVTRINQSQVVWYKNLTYLAVADNKLNTIVLSPNPSNGLVTINNFTATINTITVYDIFGKQILQQKNINNTINLVNLQTGLYFIKIETPQGVLVKKILKE